MNRLIPFLVLLLTYTKIWSQEVKKKLNFTINVELLGADSGFVTLKYFNSEKVEVLDTAYLKNNVALFAGDIEHHRLAVLKGHFALGTITGNNTMQIFLEEGKIEVKLKQNQFDQAIVKGTALNEQRQAHQNIKKENNDLLAAAHKQMLMLNSQLKENPNDQIANQVELLNRSIQDLRKYSKQLDYNYIQQNPNAEYSAYLMDYYFSSRVLSLDSAQLFIDRFDDKVKQSHYGVNIMQQVNSRRASGVGQIAPSFSKIDIDGKLIKLEQFRDKNYVLLDFWASWCVPCREENPRLKQLYTTYGKLGLEIISIAWEFKTGPWKQAIIKDGTGAWRHVMTNLTSLEDDTLRGVYSIASIPTLILINQQGEIIGRYRGASDEGSMEDLEKKLKDTIKP